MITNEDVMLSKMSYTDKDFASLYPDLLDLAKQLTNKWDPSLSNESDPGVVLLKEAAFVSDHNNYNIDKNVLENFLPSATQIESVQNIVEMNGYNPRYYVSATGPVNFSLDVTSTEFVGINVQPFTNESLVITDDDGIAYTQITPLVVNLYGTTSTCEFMEGTVRTLEVNGSSTITIDNIDSDNRLYFPIKYVAQNGIYITDNYASSSSWEKTNYLHTQPLGTKCYKVSYDSEKDLPYIEFPSDISNIIGSGITVKYIYTSGINGNVAARKLTKITSPTEVTAVDGQTKFSTDKFTLSNPAAILNGKDPETIDEMYKSFKKVVGTFDTLVTCLDYTNAVNTLTYDETNANIVSNSVVTDINTDYNNAFKVVTYDEYGPYFETLAVCKGGMSKFRFVTDGSAQKGDIKFNDNKFWVCDGAGNWSIINSITYDDFVSATEAMSQYDLCLYALKAFSMSDYRSDKPEFALNNSYTPLDEETKLLVKSKLKDYKCISHTFKDNKDGDVIMFKNYAPLTIKITPYTKVSKAERNEIINNIYLVLTENFNSSKLEFGEQLNWEEMYDKIISADTRIKNISLNDFEYNPKAVIKDGTWFEEKDVDSALLLDLAAKNILAGRVCLFSFNEDFDYIFGESDTKEYPDVVTIKTVDTITLNNTSESIESSTIETITNKNIFTKYGEKIKFIISYDDRVSPSSTLPSVIKSHESYELYADQKLIVYTADKNEYLNTYSSVDGGSYSIENISDSEINFEPISGGVQANINTDAVNLYESFDRIISEGNTTYLENYTLHENEFIELAYDNYYTDITYPMYVYYKYTYNGSGTGNNIPANEDYTLEPNYKLDLNYTTDGVEKTISYGEGDTIRSNFEIAPFTGTVAGKYKQVKNQYGEDVSGTYKSLTGSEQIDHRVILNTELTSATTYCYWIRNNNGNILFSEGSKEVILNPGEYFLYTNATKETLVVLGAGTRLVRSSEDTSEWSIGSFIPVSNITSYGIDAITDWEKKDFSGDKSFNIYEMNVLTLSENDVITLVTSDKGVSVAPADINNNWQLYTGKVIYKLSSDGSTNTLNADGNINIHIRSRLDLNMIDNKYQKLYSENNKLNQYITVTYSSSQQSETITPKTPTTSEPKTEIYVKSNLDLTLTGGDTTNIKAYTEDKKLNMKSYMLSKLTYDYNTYSEIPGSTILTSDVLDSVYKVSAGKYLKLTEGEKGLINALKPEQGDFTYSTYKQSGGTIYLYTESNSTEQDDIIGNNGVYTVELSKKGSVVLPFHINVVKNTIKPEIEEESEQSEIDEQLDYNRYIIELFNMTPDGSEKVTPADKVHLSVMYESGNADVNLKLKELGDDSTTTGSDIINLNDKKMYQIEILTTGNLSTDANVIITVDETAINSVVTIYDPKVVTGVNSEIGISEDVDNVIAHINELISNSTKPSIKPYYLYTPDNSMVLEEKDFRKANTFWDINNIANRITIPQIDIANSSIDVIPSMRSYREV